MKYPEKYNLLDYLPVTAKELKLRGWKEVDVVLITGDAYIDHPSFGAAVIGRVLEWAGVKVAVLPQPNWTDDLRDFKKFGKPRLFFAITAGNMDSMVNRYTANKRMRSNDAYTPAGRAGARPDYATVVYSKIVKSLFPEVPVVIGGVEASMRRLSHYDYWSDTVKPSILVETQADLLIYGMGERPILELVKQLQEGKAFSEIKEIPQTAFLTKDIRGLKNDFIKLYPFREVKKDKKKFAQNFKTIEVQSNLMHPKTLVQQYDDEFVVVNSPFPVENDGDIDKWYDLPYQRLPHPKYWKKGDIPAYEMIKFSITAMRGCFGGCSFCTISAHQGKFISNRSAKSILKEVEAMTKLPDFKGYITDIGGPSANMYRMRGMDLSICEKCKRPSCIFPEVCSNLETSHRSLIDLYRKIRTHPKVKKATIGSGIRYDLVIKQSPKDAEEYLREVMRYHVSGRLKVAPEHVSEKVLSLMRKPSFSYFEKFKHLFDKINKEEQLRLELIPYFISAHPDSKEEDMAELAAKTKRLNFYLEQVQDFTPTPMTAATVMYYTGLEPYSLKPLYVARSKSERTAQRDYFFWYKKEYRKRLTESLQKMERFDLLEQLFGISKNKKIKKKRQR